MDEALPPPGARTDACAEGEAFFGEGDPRCRPYEPGEVDAAAQAVRDPARWHRLNGADWLAMRLQYGRGKSAEEIGVMFGVGAATVRHRASSERWVRPMAEAGLRAMARRVWLAGLARAARGEAVNLTKLSKESEWTPVGRAFADDDTMMQMETGFDDADFRRDQHDAVRRKLDDLIAELGAKLGRDPVRAGGTDAQRDGGGPDDGGDGAQDLGAVGEEGPASA